MNPADILFILYQIAMYSVIGLIPLIIIAFVVRLLLRITGLKPRQSQR